MGLFVVDLDGDEMDVVQVSVDPEHLSRQHQPLRQHHEHDEDKRRRSGQISTAGNQTVSYAPS